MALSLERLKEALHYDPHAGLFVWRVSNSNRAIVGSTAGGKSGNGYLLIRVDGRRYLAHHLAVFYMTGSMPAGEIDHVNGVRSDNRWLNLRPATSGQNKANMKRRSDNSSGYKGVQFHPQTGKWRSRIKFNKRSISLGLFPRPEDAHAAYIAAARKYYGEFARAA